MTTEKPPAQPEAPWRDTLAYPLGCIGAFIGAALGAVVVDWAFQSGFYVIPVVGVLAGLGAGMLARKSSWSIGIIAGLVAAAVALFAEWKFGFRFAKDDSFPYFITHLTLLPKFRLLLHAVGIVAAVWFGARK